MSFNRFDYVKYYRKSDGTLLLPSEALYNGRARLIPCGDDWLVTEVVACDRPKFSDGSCGLLGSVTRCQRDYDVDPLTDEEKAESVSRSKRRARKRVRDLMDANDFEWFMTFTLDEKKIDRTDYSAFIKSVNRYFDNRVRRYGWKYVAVVEYHKRTEKNGKHALHLHAAVAGDRFNLVDSGTVVNPRGGKPITRKYARSLGYADGDLRTVYNVTDWELGHSTAIHTYGDRFALARYITKYITKSVEKVGGRWYYSGGDLDDVLYFPLEVDFDRFSTDHSYHTDFGDFRYVYYDDKKVTLDRLDGLCRQ